MQQDNPKIDRATRDAFFDAVRDGDVATVDKLLDDGVPVDLSVNSGVSPLMEACRVSQEAMARFLIDKGANIHYATFSGILPLCYAAKNLPELAKDLIRMGADMNAKPSGTAWNPLLVALESKHNNLAQFIIDEGGDLDVTNDRNESTLHAALLQAALCNRKMVRPLLEGGARLDLEGKDSLLHSALYRGDYGETAMLSAILMLVGAGADARAENNYYLPLPQLASMQCPEITPAIETMDQAPELNDEALQNATAESLLAGGNSLLDNPQTWWRLDELLTQLKRRGDMPDMAALQAAEAPDQNGYVEYGMRCAGFAHVRDTLAAHGMPVSPDMLVDGDGQKTPLLKRIIAQGELDDVFCTAYWQEHPRPEIKRVFNALSEKEQAGLPYHQLLQWKMAQETQRSFGRGT